MIPILINELEANGWANASQLTDIVAIAGMSPGPISVNSAVAIGYKVAGIPGMISAFLGIAIPCAIVVIITATFFFKIYKHQMVKAALYGLRPAITGIILFAAAGLSLKNGIIAAAPDKLIINGCNIFIGGAQIFELKSLIIAAAAFLILVKTKIHPICVITVSGIVGMIIF